MFWLGQFCQRSRICYHLIMKTIFFVILTILMSGAGSLEKPDANQQEVQGTLYSDDVYCPQFALSDGEFISLTGDVPRVDVGTKLLLKGKWRQKTKCMRGREFRVLESREIN